MKALSNENKLFVSFRVELKFNYIYGNLFLFSFPWIFNSRCDLRVDVDNCFRLNELCPDYVKFIPGWVTETKYFITAIICLFLY